MKKIILVVLFALGTIAVFSQSETSKLRIMHAQDESRLFYVNYIITVNRDIVNNFIISINSLILQKELSGNYVYI